MNMRKFVLSKIINLPYRFKFAIMVTLDLVILFLSLYISISARLGSLFTTNDIVYFYLLIISPIICIPIFYKFDLYSNLIRYINFNFIIKIFIATLIYSIIWGTIAIIFKPIGFPRSVVIINFFIALTLFANLRVLAKTLIDYSKKNNFSEVKNILIYGTDLTAISFYETASNLNNITIVGFIDNQKDIQNRLIYNVKVFSTYDLNNLVKKIKIDVIIISKNFSQNKENNQLIEFAKTNKIELRIKSENSLQIISNDYINLDDFEKLDKNFVLKRDEILQSQQLLEINIKDKVIFISGAGGSIGSEICLQCLNLKPNKIILFEQNEYALFKILKKIQKYNIFNININSHLGSINDYNLLNKIFKKEKPFTIFHTAAYKHVNIVENNIVKSFNNNVIGTYNLSKISIIHQVNNFVNISTDKAVNPISIMGCTKRLSEIIIQTLSQKKEIQKIDNLTKFSNVRFGNVIGSSGSVIPIFKKQIRDGGPVTVTHPDVSRYFMSISEAAQLVMQSSSIGNSGDIFLLEMGKPIKIVEIAKKLIKDYRKSTNSENTSNIEIVFTGLSKNEKMTEDLFYDAEKIKTIHPKIYIDSKKVNIDNNFFDEFLDLYNNANTISEDQILEFISKYLKSFKV